MAPMRREDDRLRGPDADDRLSIGWVLAGVVMFGTALAAPVAVFQFDMISAPTVADTGPTKLAATETRPSEAKPPRRVAGEGLMAQLGAGDILPGVGIGDVLLDMSVDEVLADVRAPAHLSYTTDEDGLIAEHRIHSDPFNVTLRIDPALRNIEAVTLAANNCGDLRDFQPRQNGLPATPDGLSLGSHVSRVLSTLGEPQTSDGDPATAAAHSYPGLSLTYCQADMLVGALRVQRLPPAPLLAAAPLPAELPGADLTDGSAMTIAAETLAPPVEPEVGDATTVIASALPSRGIVSVAPEPPTAPSVELLELHGEDPQPAAPAPLLALNGQAFTAGDAFSLSRMKQRSSIFTRAGAPSYMALAAVTPGFAESRLGEFEGVDEFLTQQAMTSEGALGLTPRERREMQVRLKLAGLSPGAPDGIFGPNTRAAIAKLQLTEKVPVTGYLDEPLVVALASTTDPAYKTWAARQAARAKAKVRARKITRAVAEQINASQVPAARNAPECNRDSDGTIISNQSFGCDVTVLEESLTRLFGRNS